MVIMMRDTCAHAKNFGCKKHSNMNCKLCGFYEYVPENAYTTRYTVAAEQVNPCRGYLTDYSTQVEKELKELKELVSKLMEDMKNEQNK